MKAHF